MTLLHLEKQRGGQGAWDRRGELSSGWTRTEKKVWEERGAASTVGWE